MQPPAVCLSPWHLDPFCSWCCQHASAHSAGCCSRSAHSIQFSPSAVSDSLWPHGLQHTRLPCPSSTPGAYSNSCRLRQWCHPTIAFSVVPFSSHLKSFPASESFPMSQFIASGGQNIGVSGSASSESSSVLPMNIQDWLTLGLTGWLPHNPRDSEESSPTPQFRNIKCWCLAFFIVQLLHSYMTTGKTIALPRWTFGKVMSLLFNMLSRLA